MRQRSHTALLTLAAVRHGEGERPTELLFNERQQIFILPARARRRELSELLDVSVKRRRPLKMALNPARSLVTKVTQPTDDETVAFLARKLLERPARRARVDLSRIDPTKFNLVDYYLKWPTFLLCAKVIPSYAKAKQIFDFCAAQSCNLPGPKAISPCIPFQYVVDGCYARAHKMRKIITESYGYCCEKVFSFCPWQDGNLAVRASKWGGCCVTWWYHVAPLVRVRVTILGFSIVLAMVIDPSMFDKPVLLSTWLSAQQDTSCSPNAHLSWYSIQAGSAYQPVNGGAAFSTDDAYTATDQTCVDYANLTTC